MARALDPTDASEPRQRRVVTPSARVIDPANIGDKQLSSHKKAHELEIQRLKDLETQNAADIRATAAPQNLNKRPISMVNSDSESEVPHSRPRKAPVVIEDSDDVDDIAPVQSEANSEREPTPLDTERVGSDGFLADIQVQEIDASKVKQREDSSCDVRHFFSDIFTENGKKRRRCRICASRSKSGKHSITADLSTLRRHLEAHHRGAYLAWCEKNKFESKLPKDRAEAKQRASSESQPRLTAHFAVNPDVPITYTHAIFLEAALQWLIQTNQPIQAFDHPAFQNMIRIAARATSGVKLPDRNGTRRGLMTLFMKQMSALRDRLSGDVVKGNISATCDAWQASNIDAYFAVTAHWIEEEHSGIWRLEMALLGFTQVNNAHNGKRLGQVLYKIITRIGIRGKMGYITCDNASNNTTMLKTFEDHMRLDGFQFNREKQHIRCLAHVINLATQAFLGTYSKSKPFDPKEPDEDLHVSRGQERDEIGLVRTISVKEHSSSSRKEVFMELQRRDGKSPQLHLKNDMPIRWSSTYVMLERAESLKEIVDTFVYEIARAERNLEKRKKLDNLHLSQAEWERVGLCIDLLAHADAAQQAFSSDQCSSLHLALPALEALHKAWSTRRDRLKYQSFSDALDAGIDKIAEYYDRTSVSDAYTIAMFLDPESKGNHMRRHWGEALYKEALTRLETLYQGYYERMAKSDNPNSRPVNRTGKSARRKVGRLLRELSDDEASDDEAGRDYTTPNDPNKPWLPGFNEYIKGTDHLGGSSIVAWWGLNSSRLDVWAAIARDHLPIMASSVSSERAFSAAGMTITKRRNRLKADIVEALQCLKWAISRRTFFPDMPTVSSEQVSDFNLSDDSTAPQNDSVNSLDHLIEETEDIIFSSGSNDDAEDVVIASIE